MVPRAAIPGYLATVAELAAAHGALVSGCGHVGDGNVHLSVFLPDAARRRDLVRALITEALAVGGAISGEHGIGIDKQPYFLELEDPVKLALMRAHQGGLRPPRHLGPRPPARPARPPATLGEGG